MSEDKVFADGFIAKRNDNAPDFVITGLSIKVGEAVQFLQDNQSNGWVNLQVKRARSGKLYVELDTWRPTQGDDAVAGMAQARQAAEPKERTPSEEWEGSDIPF